MFGESTPPKRLPASLAAAEKPLAAARLPDLRRVDSSTLLGPGGEVLIVHQQQVYRLRVTSLGKLILTK